MIVWIDFEATGLVATEHAVLEVAVIVTDDRLAEVGRFHRVVHWDQAKLLAHLGPNSTEDAFTAAATSMKIDRVVVELHAKSGLWAESAASSLAIADVDVQLAEFLAQVSVGPDAQKAQIAGSSIWFDRSLMVVNLPRSLRQLHYRCVDVTTLNELARRFWPRLHQGIPGKREIHRAMPDIEDSLGLCRYYVDQIAVDAGGVDISWIIGDQVGPMARGAAADYLRIAKQKVANRKAIVAVFAFALRGALDDLSPDERAVWLKLALSEVAR